MKRRILLLMMTALLSVGAWAAGDLTLNPADAKGFSVGEQGVWGFTPVSETAFTVSNWATGGWEFETALSQDDYCGVEFAFEATSVKGVTFTITFEDDETQEINVPSGSNGFSAYFAKSGGIKKMVFSYGDNDGGVPGDVTFNFTSAVVKARADGDLTLAKSGNILSFGRWSKCGWSFGRALDKDKYHGIEMSFNEVNWTNLSLKIKYANASEQEVNVAKGSKTLSVEFNQYSNITEIYFWYNDYGYADGSDNNATINFTSAVVKAHTGEVTELAFADLNPGEDTSIKDNANQTVTLTRYSTYPAWYFNPALNSDDYEKVVIGFAEAIPEDGLQLNCECDGDNWSGTQLIGLTKGATKATAYFSAKPGASIKSIGFYYSYNSKQGTDDQTTLKIASAKLIKKPTQSITFGSMTNGTVTASVTEAWEGKTVTLTAAPDTNYEFGSLTVKDEKGATVETSGSGNTYTFTMPATAVTVSATFNHVAEALNANDVELSTDMIICTAAANTSVRSVATSARYYSNSGELWVGEGEHNGWDLSLGRPVSTTEFSGVYLNYKSGTKNVKMEIVYEDGNTQTSDMLSGSNSTTIDFNKSGVVKYVKFIRDSNTEAMVAIRQIALKGIEEASTYEPTSSLTLTYETLEDGGGNSVTKVPENSEFTIDEEVGHWAGWIFTLPIPTTLYKGVNFNMTKVPENGAIEIVYGNNDYTQTLKLSEGDNIVNFVHSGNITQIKFNVAGTYQMGTCSASNTYLAKITSAKYATYGAVNDAIDYSSVSGLTAYIAKVEAGVVKLTEVSKVPANTAVVLYHETADTYTLSTTAEDNTENVDANQLHVSDGSVTGNGSTIYVLANKTSHGVGFYKFKNGSTVPAGKVYLQIPSASSAPEAPEFFGFGNGTTGITMVQGEGFMVNGSDNYHDLQGRRVAQPTKGLYIVNGKKVIIK